MSQVRAGLGGRIREARTSAGLTQADLARKAGVSERNIVRWENNQHRPRLDHLVAIAAATRVDARTLIEGEDSVEDDAESAPISREQVLDGLTLDEFLTHRIQSSLRRIERSRS